LALLAALGHVRRRPLSRWPAADILPDDPPLDADRTVKVALRVVWLSVFPAHPWPLYYLRTVPPRDAISLAAIIFSRLPIGLQRFFSVADQGGRQGVAVAAGYTVSPIGSRRSQRTPTLVATLLHQVPQTADFGCVPLTVVVEAAKKMQVEVVGVVGILHAVFVTYHQPSVDIGAERAMESVFFAPLWPGSVTGYRRPGGDSLFSRMDDLCVAAHLVQGLE
jgi:hypothetical protein